MELPQSPNIKQYARLGFEVALVVVIAIMWWDHRPKPAPVHAPMVATPNKALASTPTTIIQPKAGVVVYVPAAKKKVELPPEVQNNPSAFVIGSSSLKESDRPQTVTTTIDANTGQAQTFVTQEPYPWLAAENHRSVTVSYGIKGYSSVQGSGTAWAWRTTFKDDLAQVKALHLGMQLSADSDASYYAGIGVTYRF